MMSSKLLCSRRMTSRPSGVGRKRVSTYSAKLRSLMVATIWA
jgi:hypothetical protein